MLALKISKIRSVFEVYHKIFELFYNVYSKLDLNNNSDHASQIDNCFKIVRDPNISTKISEVVA